MTRLFTYGTLQEEKIQSQLYGRILKGEKDCLFGYVLLEQKIYGHYPVIQPTSFETDVICGMAYEISEQELYKTDVYEGECYKRKKVTLQSGNSAWVYIENTTN